MSKEIVGFLFTLTPMMSPSFKWKGALRKLTFPWPFFFPLCPLICQKIKITGNQEIFGQKLADYAVDC